jgi:hypothetical protein
MIAPISTDIVALGSITTAVLFPINSIFLARKLTKNNHHHFTMPPIQKAIFYHTSQQYPPTKPFYPTQTLNQQFQVKPFELKT